MNRRAIAVVALAALLALAGCTGDGGPETTTDQPTTDAPAPTTTVADTEGPTTTTETSEPEGPTPRTTIPGETVPLSDVSYPDGVSPEGVTNLSTLVAGHNDALDGRDFQGQLDTRVVQNGPQTTRRSNQETTFRVDADRKRAHSRQETRANVSGQRINRTAEGYTNETLGVSRVVERGNATYQTFDVESFADIVRVDTGTFDLLDSATLEPVRAVERDGRTLIVYELTDVDRSLVGANTTLESVGGRLVVDEEGMIHDYSYRLVATTTNDVGTTTVEDALQLSVTMRDVSIEEPDWLATAIEQAG